MAGAGFEANEVPVEAVLNVLGAPQSAMTGEVLPINNDASAAAAGLPWLAPTDHPCLAHGEW